MSRAMPLFPRACAFMPRTGSSFYRRNSRSGISNMHAGCQFIFYGPLTTAFGPAECQMLFVNGSAALNVSLCLGGTRDRREPVRAPPSNGGPAENQNICNIFGPPFWTRPSASPTPTPFRRHWVVTHSMPGGMTMQWHFEFSNYSLSLLLKVSGVLNGVFNFSDNICIFYCFGSRAVRLKFKNLRPLSLIVVLVSEWGESARGW